MKLLFSVLLILVGYKFVFAQSFVFKLDVDLPKSSYSSGEEVTIRISHLDNSFTQVPSPKRYVFTLYKQYGSSRSMVTDDRWKKDGYVVIEKGQGSGIVTLTLVASNLESKVYYTAKDNSVSGQPFINPIELLLPYNSSASEKDISSLAVNIFNEDINDMEVLLAGSKGIVSATASSIDGSSYVFHPEDELVFSIIKSDRTIISQDRSRVDYQSLWQMSFDVPTAYLDGTIYARLEVWQSGRLSVASQKPILISRGEPVAFRIDNISPSSILGGGRSFQVKFSYVNAFGAPVRVSNKTVRFGLADPNSNNILRNNFTGIKDITLFNEVSGTVGADSYSGTYGELICRIEDGSLFHDFIIEFRDPSKLFLRVEAPDGILVGEPFSLKVLLVDSDNNPIKSVAGVSGNLSISSPSGGSLSSSSFEISPGFSEVVVTDLIYSKKDRFTETAIIFASALNYEDGNQQISINDISVGSESIKDVLVQSSDFSYGSIEKGNLPLPSTIQTGEHFSYSFLFKAKNKTPFFVEKDMIVEIRLISGVFSKFELYNEAKPSKDNVFYAKVNKGSDSVLVRARYKSHVDGSLPVESIQIQASLATTVFYELSPILEVTNKARRFSILEPFPKHIYSAGNIRTIVAMQSDYGYPAILDRDVVAYLSYKVGKGGSFKDVAFFFIPRGETSDTVTFLINAPQNENDSVFFQIRHLVRPGEVALSPSDISAIRVVSYSGVVHQPGTDVGPNSDLLYSSVGAISTLLSMYEVVMGASIDLSIGVYTRQGDQLAFGSQDTLVVQILEGEAVRLVRTKPLVGVTESVTFSNIVFPEALHLTRHEMSKDYLVIVRAKIAGRSFFRSFQVRADVGYLNDVVIEDYVPQSKQVVHGESFYLKMSLVNQYGIPFRSVKTSKQFKINYNKDETVFGNASVVFNVGDSQKYMEVSSGYTGDMTKREEEIEFEITDGSTIQTTGKLTVRNPFYNWLEFQQDEISSLVGEPFTITVLNRDAYGSLSYASKDISFELSLLNPSEGGRLISAGKHVLQKGMDRAIISDIMYVSDSRENEMVSIKVASLEDNPSEDILYLQTKESKIDDLTATHLPETLSIGDRFSVTLSLTDKNGNPYRVSEQVKVNAIAYNNGAPVDFLIGGAMQEGLSTIDYFQQGFNKKTISLLFSSSKEEQVDSVVFSLSLEGKMLSVPSRTVLKQKVVLSRRALYISTAREGEWNDPHIWENSMVPTREDTVIINNNVRLNKSVTVGGVLLRNGVEKDLDLNGHTIQLFKLGVQSEEGRGRIIDKIGTGKVVMILNPKSTLVIPKGIKTLPNVEFIGDEKSMVVLDSPLEVQDITLRTRMTTSLNVLTIHGNILGSTPFSPLTTLRIVNSELEWILPDFITTLDTLYIEGNVKLGSNHLQLNGGLYLDGGYFDIRSQNGISKKISIKGVLKKQGGSLIVDAGSTLEILDQDNVFVIPSGINTLGRVIVRGATKVEGNLTVIGKLELEEEFDITNHRLVLHDDLSSARLNLLTGELGPSGYEVVIGGSQEASTFQVPRTMTVLNKLTINRPSVMINFWRGFVVLETLSADNSATLTRINAIPLTSKEVILKNGARIIPPLNLGSDATHRAVKLKKSLVVRNVDVLKDLINDQVSIEFWMKVDMLPSRVSPNRLVLINGSFDLSLNSQGAVSFSVTSSLMNTRSIQTTNNVIQSGSWYHVLACYVGETISVYVNGALRAQGRYSTKEYLRPLSSHLVVGSDDFSWSVDEFCLWNVGVSERQAAERMYVQKGRSEEGLVLYYQMDEGDGHSIYDHGVNMVNAQTTDNTWEVSEALINGYNPIPDNLEQKHTVDHQSDGKVVTLSELKKLAILPQHSLNQDTLLVSFYSEFDDGYKGRIEVVDKIDSLFTTPGYWQIDNLSKVNQSGKLGYEVFINNLHLPSLDEDEKRRLTFVYRYALGDKWKEIPSKWYKDENQLRAEILDGLTVHGTIELAVAIKKIIDPVLISSSRGLWSDPNTWGGRIPTRDDSVIVQHSIVLDIDGEVNDLTIILHKGGEILGDRLEKQLSIYGNILVEGSDMSKIQNGGIGTQFDAVKLHIASGKEKIVLPEEIEQLKYLQVERSGGLELISNLEITHRLEIAASEIIMREGVSIFLHGEMMGDDGSRIEGRLMITDVLRQDSFEWMSKISVTTLELRRDLVLSDDLVVLEHLSLQGGANIIRGDHGVWVGEGISSLYATQRIQPPLVSDSTASGWSAKLLQPAYVKARKHDLSNVLTVDVWIKIEDPWIPGLIVGKKSSRMGYEIKRGDTKGVIEFIVNGVVASSIDQGILFKKNKWYHIAGSIGLTKASFYANAVEISSVSLPTPFQNVNAKLELGHDLRMDELRLWNRELSRSEIEDVMGRQVWRDHGLVANYRMDEATKGVLYDYTSDPSEIQVDENVIWERSGARIEEFQTYAPAKSVRLELAGSDSKSQVSFGSDVDQVELDGVFGTRKGSIFVTRLKTTPTRSMMVESYGNIDSLKHRGGLWQIMVLRESVPDPINVNMTVPIPEELLDGLVREKDKQKLLLLKRVAPGANWEWLPLVKRIELESTDIVVDLGEVYGYVEVAFAIEARFIYTVSDGLWSNPSTWEGGRIPKETDDVSILHHVKLDKNWVVNSISLGVTRSSDVSGSNYVAGKVSGPESVLSVHGDIVISDASSLSDEGIRFFNDDSPVIRLVGVDHASIDDVYVRSMIIEKSSINDTVAIKGMLKVKEVLALNSGTLDIQNSILDIQGEIHQKYGVLAVENSEVRMTGGYQQILPKNLNFFSKLVIEKTDPQIEVKLSESIVVRDTLAVKKGSLNLVDNRYIARVVILNKPDGRIIPDIAQSSSAAVLAFNFPSVDLSSKDDHSHIYVPGSSSHSTNVFNIYNSLTVEAWILAQAWPASGSDGVILSRQDQNRGWDLVVLSDGNLQFTVYTLAEKRVVNSSQSNIVLSKDVWYHVAGVYHGTKLGLYINGILVNEETYERSSDIARVTASLGIGGENGKRGFSGMIDEVRLWAKARNSHEIINDMNTQLQGVESKLLVYYRLDDGMDKIGYDNGQQYIKIHEYTKSRLHARVLGSNLKSVVSGAFIGSFSPRGEQVEIKSLARGADGKKHTTFFSQEAELAIQGDLTNDERKVRVAHFQREPFSDMLKSSFSGILQTHWLVSPYEYSEKVENVKLKIPVKYLEDYYHVQEIDRIEWAIRGSAYSDWIILGAEFVNDALVSRRSFTLDSYNEISLIELGKITPVFTELDIQEDRVVINVEVVTDLDPYQFELKALVFDGSNRRDIITETYYQRVDSENQIQWEFLFRPELGDTRFLLEKNKNYHLTVVAKTSNGIEYELENTLYFYAKPPSVFKSQTFTIDKVLTTQMDIMPDDMDSLRIVALATDDTQFLVGKYDSSPSHTETISSDVYLASYYWTIQGNSKPLEKIQLLYPLDRAYQEFGKTSNLKWFRKKDLKSSWIDVTHDEKPFIEIDGVMYLQTQYLDGFSDYVIGVSEEFLRIPGVIFPIPSLVLSNRVSDSRWDALLGAELLTGHSMARVKILYDDTESLSSELAGSTKEKMLPRYPFHVETKDEVQGLQPNRMYYFSIEAYNRLNTKNPVQSDTGWFFTMLPETIMVDTVSQKDYNLGQGTAISVGKDLLINMKVDLATSSLGDKKYLFAIERYLLPPIQQNRSFPPSVSLINPIHWRISPVMKVADEKMKYVPLRSTRLSRADGMLRSQNHRIGRSFSEFATEIDPKKVTWLRRGSAEDQWEDIGSEVVEVEGQKYLFSTKLFSEIQGEYAIGLKEVSSNQASMVMLFEEEFQVTYMGGNRARIQWQDVSYTDEFIGYELVRASKHEEKIIATMVNQSRMKPGEKTNAYDVIDHDVEYGNTYEYRLRLYNKNGYIHEYDSRSIISIPESDAKSDYTSELSSNYPNPFSYETTIEYSLPDKHHVTLYIFDVLGRKVATLVDKIEERGSYRVIFAPVGMPAGMYFYRISTGYYRDTKKMMYLP